jgi:hypothetical protein
MRLFKGVLDRMGVSIPRNAKILWLVEDRPNRQIALQDAEGFLHGHQLQVVIPQLDRIGLGR